MKRGLAAISARAGRAAVVLLAVVPLVAGAAAGHPPGSAVTSSAPAATRAGIEVLRAGGNAFDAAVAVAAALTVVRPDVAGLGGGGLWLLGQTPRQNHSETETLIDGSVRAPTKGFAPPRKSGRAAIAAIPGTAAALARLADFGRLGLARDLQPALRLASDGYTVDTKLAQRIAAAAARLSPAARAVFLPHGKAPAAGQTLRQPALAHTLEQLARRGAAGFYHGAVAKMLVQGVTAAGGAWSEADLARYRAPERRPIVSYFRPWRLVLAPPPSASGAEVTEILQQLEARGWRRRRTAADDAMVLEAMRRADRDRDAFLGDPDFVDAPLHLLRSMTYADWLARTTDPAHATPPAALPAPADIAPRPADCPAPPAACGSAVRHAGDEGRGAALFTVIDNAGNRVAGTMTLGSRFGSGYMPPHSGVLLNDRLRAFTTLEGGGDPRIDGQRGNRPAARKRPLSSLGPAFVEGPRGLLVLAAGGGRDAVAALTLGILRCVRGQPLREIVGAPRFALTYGPDHVRMEAGAFDAAERHALQGMGYALKTVHRPLGRLQAILWTPADQHLTAATDPRGAGDRQRLMLHPVPRLRPAGGG